MKTLTEHLAQYASYHRDQRNILTHFIGIPMIVLSISTLLSRPVLATLDLGMIGVDGGLPITPTLLVSVLAGLFYLKLDLRYGVAMAVWLLLSGELGWKISQGETSVWLATGVGLFVVGWIAQFIGHYYEGRKPAFVDDLVGLAIGPLFVMAEASFLLGLRRDLSAEVQARSGAVH